MMAVHNGGVGEGVTGVTAAIHHSDVTRLTVHLAHMLLGVGGSRNGLAR